MRQTGMCPTFFQDLFDALLLAKGFDLSDKLDLKIFFLAIVSA
jgi:hypothetical protein